ncbi:MAG: MarR family transcriptional regulator, partial [Acinetobacter sp.]
MSPQLKFRASLLRCARLMSDEINTILLPYQLNYSLWQVLYVIQLKQG